MSLAGQVGISDGEDSYAVGANAGSDAVNKLGGDPDLLIVFASVQYDQEKMLSGVRSAAKGALIVGTSTAGEITTAGPAKKHSVTVMAIKSPDIKFYAGIGENIAAGPRAAGRKVTDPDF